LDEKVKNLTAAQKEMVVRFSNELLLGGPVVVFTQRMMMTNCDDPEIARKFASGVIDLEREFEKSDQ